MTNHLKWQQHATPSGNTSAEKSLGYTIQQQGLFVVENLRINCSGVIQFLLRGWSLRLVL